MIPPTIPDAYRLAAFTEPSLYRPALSQLPAAVIVDMDGTLAIHEGRTPFEWERVGEDLPNWPVIVTVRNLQRAGYLVIVMTGRMDTGNCRRLSEEWLGVHLAVPYEKLVMRPADDYRADTELKEELYHEHVDGQYHILAVFDDRASVVKMWRSLDLVVFQVADGDF